MDGVTDTLHAALAFYANPLNWASDESGIRRVWLEPGSTTPDAYNGFELASSALATPQPAILSAPAASAAEVVQDMLSEPAYYVARKKFNHQRTWFRPDEEGAHGEAVYSAGQVAAMLAAAPQPAIAPAAPVAEALAGVAESGPWRAVWGARNGHHGPIQCATLQSDDFTHDVVLYVSGDFDSDAQQVSYAEEIARRLNAAPAAAGSAEPASGAQEAGPVADWRPMHEAPKDAEPVLLLVPTRWAKRSTSIQTQGYWFDDFWVVVNADEAVQRVEPIGWMPLHNHAAPQAPASPAVLQRLTDGELDAVLRDSIAVVLAADRQLPPLKNHAFARDVESALARKNGATLTQEAP